MNFQRIRALTVKEILRVLREPANLFMLIMLPLVMTLVFGIAFGGIGGGEVQSLGDHRIAMAAAVAGLRADGPVEIIGAECAAVSWPEFYETLEEMW